MARVRQVDRNVGLDAAGPRRHHDHARGHEDRFLDVMGDEQHRLLAPLPNAEEQFLHQPARLVVQRAERLVEQKDRGIVAKSARDRRALLHAARKLLRPMIFEAFQPDKIDIRGDDLVALALAHAALAQTEADVFGDRQPRKQRVGLEHHATIWTGPGDGVAIQQHAAGARRLQPGDDPEQGRFSTAGRAENGDEIIGSNREVDRLERLQGLAAPHPGKGPGNALDQKLAHARLHG